MQDGGDVKEGRGEMNTGDVDSWKCQPNWLQGAPRKTKLVWAPDEETSPAVGRMGRNPCQFAHRQPEKKGAETLFSPPPLSSRTGTNGVDYQRCQEDPLCTELPQPAPARRRGQAFSILPISPSTLKSWLETQLGSSFVHRVQPLKMELGLD